ncbi:hypothetical protein FrEUN1fDRAFT_1990 [Parafrankia sp. EUN1f]|nr:hypothetical protein FrEUN1fDRAFT_1990 [Parafrankia sp. EUN1f]
MARIHGYYLDLAAARLPINDDSDETDGASVDVRNPDPGFISPAGPAHILRMRHGPVRPYPKKNGTPKHLFDRCENRAPCTRRQCNHLFHIRGNQWPYHQIHTLSVTGVGMQSILSRRPMTYRKPSAWGDRHDFHTGPLITPDGLSLKHERRSPAVRTTIPPGKG